MSENGPVIAEIIEFQWACFLQALPVTCKAQIETEVFRGKDGQARIITFDWLNFLWQVDIILDQDKTDKFLYPDENITDEIAL